ncbi:NADH-quinone oxidoreductase subunit NuoN [Cupriavidus pauculus]|jgi:NADH-quinone oxidoreductase subunit N|uniref:NADH-quinone oxidoreductase subunit NuoN n=1 Tax=Cupriavidus pauculus TaxID=82633 RepID=UPI0007866BC0|nr:NADH-quinone oxidoreductase subunit NuoN [Cupriavidus pauculus]KAB0604545.1 NADH-quinone oxidoreductase subunit NuoN [Cupriavidus pauculus]MBY4729746.1 NADH-quinone oxidoreductase subunit NuoN [Cupriavidus pauculus]MCM3606963.1 NADH-quinone oxidoreductase subunit NuoN [Cupriavidus pauculus]UAK99021.1 NADH-quinone oxidoreductase subunit NuoN [Cupriavidus pauculus]
MQSSSSLAPVAPIIFLAIAIAAINWIDLARGKARTSVAYPLSLLTTLVLAVWFAMNAAGGETHYAFANLVVIDPMANVLSAFCALGMLLTLVYTRTYLGERDMFAGEFYMLALFTLGGQIVMITGNNFLTLYLGLELLSLSSYALVALRRDSRVTSESAIKYFVLGALASGFLLYGMSMMYGATGSLNLGEVFRVVESGRVNTTMLAFGVVFIVAGVSFKLGAAPFHMWIPDIYQGSPTAVTLLIAAGPKVAAFALIMRLLVEGLLPLATDWQTMLVVLSIASLIIGNLTAIVQTNLKRMLAYSTISHMGFILLGMLSGVVANKADGAANAYSASMFYSITYMLTTLGTFGLILIRTRKGFEAETLDDLKGMSRRHPWFALLMLVMMFSMAGIPPTVGFYAKLAVLQAVVKSGMTWLAVLAVVFSLIGAFYYLRVVKLMYFDAPAGEEPLEASMGLRSVLSLNGLAVILLGLFPAALMNLCYQAIRATLAS